MPDDLTLEERVLRLERAAGLAPPYGQGYRPPHLPPKQEIVEPWHGKAVSSDNS